MDAGTIRNWERRYGVVRAARSPGGQRLYSLEDIDRLRRLKTSIDGGLSAGEAHSLLRDQLSSGRLDPADERVRDRVRRVRAAVAETQARVDEYRAALAPRDDEGADPRQRDR